MTKSIESKEQPKELANVQSFLKENRSLGAEEASQEDLRTPTLMLIQNNSTITDDENRPYARGKFFYKGTRALIDVVEGVILTFSKVEMPTYSDKSVKEKQYKLAGVLGEKKLPFVMYLRSTGIGAFKNFYTEVHNADRPLFSVAVKMTVEKIDGEKGTYYKPKFSIKSMIDSMEELQVLRELTKRFREVLKTDDPHDVPDDGAAKASPGENLSQDVAPDEVPF